MVLGVVVPPFVVLVLVLVGCPPRPRVVVLQLRESFESRRFFLSFSVFFASFSKYCVFLTDKEKIFPIKRRRKLRDGYSFLSVEVKTH